MSSDTLNVLGQALEFSVHSQEVEYEKWDKKLSRLFFSLQKEPTIVCQKYLSFWNLRCCLSNYPCAIILD